MPGYKPVHLRRISRKVLSPSRASSLTSEFDIMCRVPARPVLVDSSNVPIRSSHSLPDNTGDSMQQPESRMSMPYPMYRQPQSLTANPVGSAPGAPNPKAFPLDADSNARVPLTEISPELADAADVLSDQLRVHLHRLGGVSAAARRNPGPALPGQAETGRNSSRGNSSPRSVAPWLRSRPARPRAFSANGQPPLKFIEQVEYNGRRLAKLNLPPSSIVEALAGV